MKSIAEKRRRMRIRRHLRIRKKLAGTSEVPRLAVYRSSKHIYAQLVNDLSGVSLCGTSSLDPAIKESLKGLKKAEKSKAVGKRMAEIALEKGILRIAFDRGGYVYHGRIQALAEGAREGGLRF